LIQQSIKTKSKRIAQIRLREAMDKLDKTLGVTQVDRAATSSNATFAELVEVFKRDIDLSEREHSTKTKIIYQLNGFIKHWTKVPELRAKGPFLELTPKEVTLLDFRYWRRWFSQEFGADYTNNCLRHLRALYGIARKTNPFIDDATMGVEWTKQEQKELILPSKDKCRELLDEVRKPLCGWSADAADLIEGIIYLGVRRKEARLMTAAHVRLDRGLICLSAGITKGRKGARKARIIPIIPGTEKFWERLVSNAPNEPRSGFLFKVSEATETQARACEKVGIQRLTHHKLRHFWATLALESGASPKMVAEWLGHQDGGVLVMKRNTHVRTEYSREAAQRLGITFTFIRPEALLPSVDPLREDGTLVPLVLPRYTK